MDFNMRLVNVTHYYKMQVDEEQLDSLVMIDLQGKAEHFWMSAKDLGRSQLE